MQNITKYYKTFCYVTFFTVLLHFQNLLENLLFILYTELVKNIFFNTDKLIENETVKISYTGKFFKENFDEVYVHFGFGDNWDNLSEIKMNKTELGFQAEINLVSTENLNLCFRTNTNEWDNNSGSNYSFHIEPVSVAMVAKK